MKRMILLLLLIAPPAAAQEAPTTPPNGNSAFAVSLFSKMTPEQYGYYHRIFEQLMDDPQPVSAYGWQTGNAAGKISAAALFTTKTGASCRPFSESYAVGEEAQSLSGVACRRPQGGWCKLRANTTYNCALENRNGIGGFLDDATVNVNRWGTQMNRLKYKIESLF